MKNYYTFWFVFIAILFFNLSKAQVTQDGDYIPGTICKNIDCSNVDLASAKIQNGNGTIATSYTVSACGLNFTTVTVRLNQRSFGFTPATGVPQPAAVTVSGMPACITASNITRAFLYCGGSGNGIAVTATIKNSANVTQNFAMSIIGQHVDKCWGYAGTYNYRADVTSIIIGNGSYTISGLPTNPPTAGNDTDGATLFIIYRDPSQTYTGHFVIADGCREGSGAATNVITGFNVCGATNSQTNFAIASDLQRIGNVPFKLNSATDNFTLATASQNVWDYVSTSSGAATAGQTSATFGITTGGDCWNLVAAGMYFRTSCLACTSTPCVVLPIELLSFNSECENDAIRLNWETSTERNNKSFLLLRSENGKDFETVAELPGSKNSNTKRSYSFLDRGIIVGKSYYYKLLNIDTDGSENDSGKMISVHCKNRNSTVEITPNPSGNETFIVSENDLINVDIIITDGLGTRIKTFTNVNLPKGQKFLIDMGDVKNGYYHLRVSGEKTVIQKKIVIYK